MHSKQMTADRRDTCFDVTDSWNRCHAHLAPFSERLPLAPDDRELCLLCGDVGATALRAHLRFGPSDWVENAVVCYCAACQRFTVKAEQQALASTDAQLLDQPITAVDARLWSREPTSMLLEPTTRCNFSCWYCVGRHMEQADLNVDDFAKILDNFPTLKQLALVGEGEPFLHVGFFEMAAMARDRGIQVSTLSNGSAFTQSVVEKICRTGIVYVAVSIDSIDPEQFAKNRIGGDLNKIWQGIDRLRRYRDENGYKLPMIALQGTLFKDTKDELPNILTEAKRRGFDAWLPFQPLNPMQTYLPIYPAQHTEELDHVQEVRAALRRDLSAAASILPIAMPIVEQMMSAKPNGLRANCDEQFVYSLLSGDVTPCAQLKKPMGPAWNIVENKLSDIFSNHHYEQVRFNLYNGLFPNYCSGCVKVPPRLIRKLTKPQPS